MNPLKTVALSLIATAALAGSPTVNALDAGNYQSGVEYCQSVIHMSQTVADMKRKGISINVLLKINPGTDVNPSAAIAIKERVTRVYSADDPDREVRKIGAECVIAHGLVPVN